MRQGRELPVSLPGDLRFQIGRGQEEIGPEVGKEARGMGHVHGTSDRARSTLLRQRGFRELAGWKVSVQNHTGSVFQPQIARK